MICSCLHRHIKPKKAFNYRMPPAYTGEKKKKKKVNLHTAKWGLVILRVTLGSNNPVIGLLNPRCCFTSLIVWWKSESYGVQCHQLFFESII